MRVWLAGAVVVAMMSAASARPADLDPHDAGAFTVSLPTFWKVSDDGNNVVAQADATRPDAPELVVIAAPSSATDKQVIDATTGKLATHVRVTHRGSGPGGTGSLVVAAGSIGPTAVRLGALAVRAHGTLVVCVLVAKPAEYDHLGGTQLLAQVAASFRRDERAAPAGDAPPLVTHDPMTAAMIAQYDSYHALIVPPPPRPATVADLAGTWNNDASAIARWSTTYGSTAEYSSSAIAASWRIDARGRVEAEARHDAKDGTISLTPDGVVTLTLAGAEPAYYILRGWFFDGRTTVITLNGPYYRTVELRALRDRNYATNLNSYWVRASK